ncbi:MAG: PmoA family protein, partial [Tannerella sp.]|nr:PmoA family protein [Tannerella sp.]
MNARKIRLNFIKIIVPVLFIAFSCSPKIVTVNDSAGILGKTHAPVSVKMNWANKYEPALVEITDNGEGEEIPVRLKKNETDSELILVMPAGKPGIRKFKVVRKTASLPPVMVVEKDSGSGQFVIKESGKSVLQYNYQTVNEDNVIRVASKKDIKPVYKPVSFPAGNVYRDEYLKSHPEIKDNVITSAIWAVPRSNYIHPLYGLNGEMLTNDWPDGSHPHHRGIFWAWPEVEYKSQHGDLYALLRVFARPTGNIKYTSGSVFAEIDAENLWMWKDKEPIVREQVTIRVYRSSQESRVIDLTVSLLAMVDSVTVATRSTNSYGGLCFRMETPQKQDISYYSDKP